MHHKAQRSSRLKGTRRTQTPSGSDAGKLAEMCMYACAKNHDMWGGRGATPHLLVAEHAPLDEALHLVQDSQLKVKPRQQRSVQPLRGHQHLLPSLGGSVNRRDAKISGGGRSGIREKRCTSKYSIPRRGPHRVLNRLHAPICRFHVGFASEAHLISWHRPRQNNHVGTSVHDSSI